MTKLDRQAENASVLVQRLGLTTRQFKLYLAQNVTSARRRAGLTQLQLANAAELSRATVRLIEAGICDPRLFPITRLASARNVGVLDLLAKNAS